MSLITIPFTFSAGAVIVASQHNSNFSTIYADYNGNIDNNNISALAAIVYSKLSLAGSIVNADINNSAAIANTKLNLASITGTINIGTAHQGDIFYDNGTTLTRLTPGTSGQVLMTQGAAANPLWGTNGATSLISNTTISSATNSGDITIVATNFYQVKIVVRGFSADDSIAMRFNNDTGASYNYITRGFVFDGTPTASNSVATGATSFVLGPADAAAAAEQLVFTINIYPQRNDNQTGYFKGEMMGQDSSAAQYYKDIAGNWGSGGNALTSFRILTTGGATFSGNILLYKLATS